MAYRISVDVGGTFTDLTIADETMLLGRFKSPTTPEDLSRGLFNCLDLAAEALSISVKDVLSLTGLFIHGSTTATNAILEWKGAKCGVICTKGHKYNLWKGEGRRLDVFNYKMPNPRPLIRPYLCLEVTERLNSEGDIVVPLIEDEVRAVVKQFKEWDVKAIAVCLLWSITNPMHEQRIGQIIEEEWPGVTYCLSSEIQPIIREYHRMSCVTLNSMLRPIVSEYLEELQEMLKDNGFGGEVLIAVSNGGIVPASEIIKKPVFMLLSGPAMGPVAGLFFGEREQKSNILIIDMGGTSFDVSTVIDSQISTTREGRILGYPTGLNSTEILTLGAGGGSIGWVDAAGRLNVGPQSSGAVPGPACYMRGGTEPTVTDACVVLGYIIPSYFLGGRMKISPEFAKEAINEKIAEPLNLSIERAALGICQVCKEKMVGAMLDMTVRKGIDPRDFIIVAGGGATGMFAAGLAKEIGVKQVIIPRETSVLCSFGALNADVALSSVASKYTDTKVFDYAGVNSILEELESKGEAFLASLPSGERKFEYHCSARYPMQVTELEIPLPKNRLDPEVVSFLAQQFHETSQARYKACDTMSPVEFVMWRHVAMSCKSRMELPMINKSKPDSGSALKGKQKVYFEGEAGFIETPYYEGDELYPGLEIGGPAIIGLSDTTIVIPPLCKITTQPQGYYIMDIPT